MSNSSERGNAMPEEKNKTSLAKLKNSISQNYVEKSGLMRLR